LDWSGDSTHAEWVAGEVIVFMPPVELHQLVEGFAFSLLERFVGLYDLGVVLQAPFEMKLPDGSSREPDLLFVAREHFDRRTAERLVGPADLLMEILSDSTARYDRYEKFFAYERAGVPEYWLIDPRPGRQKIEVFALSPDGRYRPLDPDSDGRYHSLALPGFWFDPRWLSQLPLPDPEDAILEVAPDAYFEKIRTKYEARRRSPGNGSPSHR
ncbi:MAG TPA: Uma2 family endonuclease, partial [Thermomicrobiales bacterium]